ncbi:SPOR domain-containing protein [Novosphingobium gossypii]|uniref:SPOR domain-containing protein n=1 Tax=Novosphingobium gossypii TaxID=1604774 RepID=UPI003D198025
MDQLVSRLLGGSLPAAVLVAALGAVVPTAPASAQGVSHPVVQALPSEDNKKLSSALQRLGRDGKDVSALIDAGDAARGLNDYAAAIGFYRRAAEASPGDPRVQAGLGSAFVHNGDPVSAIPHFDAAEKSGTAPGLIAADRGLAYDLVGDNATAQQYYALALPSATGDKADELRNRLAVSQAIGGDVDAAYKTLLPLLNRQDKPGWRTRAFTLAIAGDTDQAVNLAGRILPGQLAQNVAPYLRYMPRLTRAQQAAAANLGRFPRASEIGRDDARIAAYAPPRATAAGAGLIPKGEPLGGTGMAAKLARNGKTSRTRAGKQASAPLRVASIAAQDPDRVAPPEPKPAIEREGGELPPVGRGAEPASVGTTARIAATPSMTAAKTAAAKTAATRTAPAATTPTTSVSAAPSRLAQATPATASPPVSAPVTAKADAPGFDLARMSASAGTPAPAPAAAPPVSAPSTPPPVPGPNQLSLSEIFADIGRPTAEAMPTAGAVDIRLITPAAPPTPPAPRVQLPKVEQEAPAAEAEKPDAKATPKTATTKAAEAKAKLQADAKAKAEAKAKADAEAKAKAKKKPSHPSRMWVQIGVGRNKDAIAFDWRRYTRESAALLKGRAPYVSEMGRTNRILIGPFATQKAANAFLADAKKNGFSDALPWTSPAGQVVDPLSEK